MKFLVRLIKKLTGLPYSPPFSQITTPSHAATPQTNSPITPRAVLQTNSPIPPQTVSQTDSQTNSQADASFQPLHSPATLSDAGSEETDDFAPEDFFPEPVVLEIRDVLDLHTIPPRQVREIVEEYLRLAHEQRFRHVRLIHGKGIGVQREIVRSVLARTTFVIRYSDAPPEAGGWGATIAELSVADAGHQP